jgi:hypothetical protein
VEKMTALVSSCKGRMAKDKKFHKIIAPYIRTCITSGKKPFAFNKMKEAIIKQQPHIETINIKLDNSHNITYIVKFVEPQFYMKIEGVDLCIQLECLKQINENIREDLNLAKKMKKVMK